MASFTVDDVLGPFSMPRERLEDVKRKLRSEMDLGLAQEGATIKMLPTYVHDLPNGTEKGKFLALDLGGSNFRVLLITLDGRENYQQVSTPSFPKLTDEQKQTTGTVLFDHIAKCLSDFKEANNISEKLPLGFTFSFPVNQVSLTSGTLISWTKGFRASGVEGADIVQLLRDALARRKDVDVDVVALVNDTTGTMMSRALEDPDCKIGLILGTGTNACYMESLDAVGKWTHPRVEGVDQVAVNTEWGAFGDNGLLDDIFTEFDRELDQRISINPGKQLFEKTISGMYLGEIVRLVCVKLISGGHLFPGQSAPAFSEKFKFESEYVSKIEAGDESVVATRDILARLGVTAADDDCKLVRRVCAAVSTRAARLAAAGITTIVEKINSTQKCTVAVDGSLYKFHPQFRHRMSDCFNELLPAGHGVVMKEATDGSGRGAALVAAVAVRLSK